MSPDLLDLICTNNARIAPIIARVNHQFMRCRCENSTDCIGCQWAKCLRRSSGSPARRIGTVGASAQELTSHAWHTMIECRKPSNLRDQPALTIVGSVDVNVTIAKDERMRMTEHNAAIAKMIDHSLLHPTMTDRELAEGCRIAVRYDVASVCIKPYAVPMARDLLAGSSVLVCTVIGFPHGSSHTSIKLKEAELALAEGALELDVVVNVGKVLSGDWPYVSQEVRLINELVAGAGGLVKLIFENDFLPGDVPKIRLCHLCNENGIAFAKTSTGYGFVKQANGQYSYAGATDADLVLMRRECAPSVQIKAAGGIRTLDDLRRVAALGVTRVGATATAAILDEAIRRRSQGDWVIR